MKLTKSPDSSIIFVKFAISLIHHINGNKNINNDAMPLEYSSDSNEIILYQPDSTLSLDVRVENETVWLTQAQMVDLFQSTKQNISLHINNIFKEGELQRNSVVK